MKYEVKFSRKVLQEATVIVDLTQELTSEELNQNEHVLGSLAREIAYDKAVFHDVKELSGDSNIRQLK